jgi:hypothetical protein
MLSCRPRLSGSGRASRATARARAGLDIRERFLKYFIAASIPIGNLVAVRKTLRKGQPGGSPRF